MGKSSRGGGSCALAGRYAQPPSYQFIESDTMSAARTIECPHCGNKIRDNPDKHRDRPKICNECKKPYNRGLGSWKPNLGWVKEKLRITDDRKLERTSRKIEREAIAEERSRRSLDDYHRRLGLEE